MSRRPVTSPRTAVKKQAGNKSASRRKATSPASQPTAKPSVVQQLRAWLHRLQQRRHDLLRRRPHRSFRRTPRRDYRRSLAVPGYWALTAQTVRMIWRHRRTFFSLALWYGVLVIVLMGLTSQDVYQQLKQLMQEGQEQGVISQAAAIVSLFWGAVVSSLPGANGDVSQQLIGMMLFLIVWLTTVWLTRAIMAGGRPKMRDGLYAAGAPVVALMALTLVLAIQLLPAAIGIIVYGALDGVGVLAETPMLMLAGGVMILLVVLSLYWVTATLFAMVIVGLPGMYPLEALRMAGDVVIGRRIRILLRLMWLVVMILLLWAVVILPLILLDAITGHFFESFAVLPIVPLGIVAATALSTIFAAVYVYLFYRKVVDDDSAPA